MKDPAALVYIDKWSAATKGMRGAEKGWYFDLVLHQFDKGYIPNDFDEICSICSVRPSEYDLFKQVFEQVLNKKFPIVEGGVRKNEVADEIIQGRQFFKDKRSRSGKVSYIMKFARRKLHLTKEEEEFLKANIDSEVDTKNEQVLLHMFKQVFEQKSELYINIIVDINRIINTGKGGVGEKPKDPEPKKESSIPSYEDFELYAKEKEPSVNLPALKNKYDAWKENDWKDGNNQRITNWKSKLLNTMPYLPKNTENGKSNTGNKTAYKFDLNRAISSATGGTK